MTATQSESLQGRKFAQAYVHAGMIGLDGEKMSKSKGNLVFVSKLIGEGVEPIAIRTALMLDHYQEDRMWEKDKLESAIRIVERMRSALSREIVAPTDTVVQSIADMIANNLDTSSIFLSLQEWCERTENGGSGGSAGELSRALDAYLGLAF
jgi:L-cysteine:1D-myo-inositol 2-amino-2-deoxy-alpha-D-glucopyranoside ligase